MKTYRGDHDMACALWLQSRPETDLAIRDLLAGKMRSPDHLSRPVVVTAIGGHYEQPAGWAIALNGSPVQALIVVLNDGWKDGVIWRGENQRALRGNQRQVVWAYLESLSLPGLEIGQPYPFFMVIDGEPVTGPTFHVKPWFWREPDLYDRIGKEVSE